MSRESEILKLCHEDGVKPGGRSLKLALYRCATQVEKNYLPFFPICLPVVTIMYRSKGMLRVGPGSRGRDPRRGQASKGDRRAEARHSEAD